MWISVYWGGLTVGRLLAGVAVGFMPANRLLPVCVAGMALGAALIWLNVADLASFLGLGLMGLWSAPVFPLLIATTPARLGLAHTRNGVGFQIAAAVLGQSLLPALIGVLAGKYGLEIIGPALLVAAVVLFALVQGLTAGAITVEGGTLSEETNA